MPDPNVPDVQVDARGLYCPIPVLRLAKALRQLPSGAVALLLATDPAADEDVRVFCRETGNRLLSRAREGKILSFRVRKRAARGAPHRRLRRASAG